MTELKKILDQIDGLTQYEKEDYEQLINASFLKSFKSLAGSTPEELVAPTIKRSYMKRPFSDDDNNAWYVKTNFDNDRQRGSLAGKRIAVKDNIAIANVPMQLGTSLLDGFKPKEDATVVTRLVNAGANLTGKAVSENLFCAGSSFTAATGPVMNPRLPGYSAGGSSSGSAALVASHEVEAALGCDQTGSIRIPAAWCGIIGFKPSRGIIPYTGIVSVDPMLDCVGPLANDMGTLLAVLDVISGKDFLDSRQGTDIHEHYSFRADISNNISGKKIGVVVQGFQIKGISEKQVDYVVKENIDQFKRMGVQVENISIPEFDLGRTLADVINTISTYRILVKQGGVNAGYGNYYPVDVAEEISQKIKSNNFSQLAPIVQAIIYTAMFVCQQKKNYYARAQNLLQKLKKAFSAIFAEYDILALPTVPYTATKLPSKNATLDDQITASMGMDLNTGIFNVLGFPAISIPCKLGKTAKPVGMMLVGNFLNDQCVLNFASQYEKLFSTKL